MDQGITKEIPSITRNSSCHDYQGKFTMDDARQKREPIEYAQIITRAARSAEMSMYNQVYLIYNGLNIEFRRDIPIPNENTDLDEFLQELDRKKEIWWAIDYRNKGYIQGNLSYQRQEFTFSDKNHLFQNSNQKRLALIKLR